MNENIMLAGTARMEAAFIDIVGQLSHDAHMRDLAQFGTVLLASNDPA